MSSTMLILLAVVVTGPAALAVAIMYILGPILAHRRPAAPYRPEWKPTEYERLTPELREFIRSSLARFAGAGFDVALNLQTQCAALKTNHLHVLMINNDTRDIACLNSVRGPQFRILSLAIISSFPDGTRLSSSCKPFSGLLPRDPLEEELTVPWVRDVPTLWELHQRRMADRGKTQEARIAPGHGAELDYFLDREEQEASNLVRAGYMKIDEPAGLMWYTWKGAALMVWKFQPPIKQWRAWRHGRNARAEWTRLGMDAWSPPSTGGDDAESFHADGGWPESAGLEYEARLAEGEIRITESKGRMIARVGTPTRGQVLARKWLRLTWMGLLTLLLTAGVFVWMTRIRPRLTSWEEVPWLLVFLGIYLVADWIQVVLELRRARGTVMLVATSAGLEIYHPGQRTPHKRIDRMDIVFFLVRLHALRFRKSVYALDLRTLDGAKHILVHVADRAALEELKLRLSQAMGIEPTEPASN